MIFYEKFKFKEVVLEVVLIFRSDNVDEIKKVKVFVDVVVEKEYSSNK